MTEYKFKLADADNLIGVDVFSAKIVESYIKTLPKNSVLKISFKDFGAISPSFATEFLHYLHDLKGRNDLTIKLIDLDPRHEMTLKASRKVLFKEKDQ